MYSPESGGAGVPHYIFHVAKNLLAIDRQNEYFLFFDEKSAVWDEFKAPNVHCVLISGARFRRFLPLVYSQLVYAWVLRRFKLDIFHATNTGIPYFYRGRSITTVHDLGVYLRPEFFSWGQRLGTRLIFPHSFRRAAKIILVSWLLADDMNHLFPEYRHKLTAIQEGVSPVRETPTVAETDAVMEKFQLRREKFFLFIGTLEPRKNLLRLIAAFEKAMDDTPSAWRELKLVLAGRPGYRSAEIVAAARHSRYARFIILPGYISAQEKNILLREAAAFVFPSLWEGFGLGNLEAMAVGTPVIASDIPVVREITGGAATLVHPEDIFSWSKRMRSMVTNKEMRERLHQAGYRRVSLFSWKLCAQQTLAEYEKLQKIKV
ncbi:MAG: hypothetical protein A3F54_05625 [Candidatus Kerfeldbacteria bacterium RIFCSPHIGHO2_12_FULL_48_17]|uniref:Uncharacterized protein n=1 Tax=Candidatus Kerfeldbacteria bacterium RIFCSPHIGHO2_12_FULL_48_17 TaxID=1798542 RepID=A0A1G2B8L0_9BACT|nr:MAG: hypothetical protein A3F54_05625 [Candidatus Kerfeldbacteria bacterium RIFCSPHIGHO2_12_FULL_48_17]